MATKPCPCGSGECRSELRDAQGIFCCFYCHKCEKQKRERYNPGIFSSSAQDYAEATDYAQIEDDY